MLHPCVQEAGTSSTQLQGIRTATSSSDLSALIVYCQDRAALVDQAAASALIPLMDSPLWDYLF